MLEKRFSHGVQFQAAYTFSKSLDWASSFEETLNPFDFKKKACALSCLTPSNGLSLTMFGIFRCPKYQGIKGKILDDWETSPASPSSRADFRFACRRRTTPELIGSLFFFGTAAPQMTGTVPQLQNPKVLQTINGVTGHFYLNSWTVRRSNTNIAGDIFHHAAVNLLWPWGEPVGPHVIEEDFA